MGEADAHSLFLPLMNATTFHSPDLTADAVVAVLTGAGFEAGRPAKVSRTVLDTFDGRLHAAGLRLELQSNGSGGRTSQLVLSDRNGAAPASVPVDGPPSVVGDFPPGPFRARLASVLDVRAVRPVLTVTARVTTAARRDKAGKARVTVAVHDRLDVAGNGGDLRPWLATVHPQAGYPAEADKARSLLAGSGLTSHDGDVVDAVVADLGVSLDGFTASPTVPLRADEPALGAFRRTLDNLAVAIEANQPGTLGAVDPEFLHDLRVAVRRTRSVLAQGRRVLPSGVRRRYREEFGWLGGATGPARDLDVYVIEWDAYVAMVPEESRPALAPVLDHLMGRRADEHAALATVLRSKRYRSLLAGWRAWLGGDAPEDAGPDAGRPIGAVARDRIASAQDQLLAGGRAIGPDSPAEDLHELRKDAKKLRYLLECFGGLYAAKDRKPFVQRLKALQDNLGEHQDAEVHVAQLRSMADELHRSVGPETLIAIGQLSGQLEARRQAARAEFAERFAAYDTKKTASALLALLSS